jgi:hypothetical protein
MFVHDFIQVDLPMDAVLDALSGDAGLPFERLVLQAWAETVGGWDGEGFEPSDLAPPPALALTLGALRVRQGSVVVAVAWSNDGRTWFPAVDADLEIVAFGANRTNLHLLGRYSFGAGAVPRSASGSAAHLLTVLSLRRFLQLLAGRILERHQLAPPGRQGR